MDPFSNVPQDVAACLVAARGVLKDAQSADAGGTRVLRGPGRVHPSLKVLAQDAHPMFGGGRRIDYHAAAENAEHIVGPKGIRDAHRAELTRIHRGMASPMWRRTPSMPVVPREHAEQYEHPSGETNVGGTKIEWETYHHAVDGPSRRVRLVTVTHPDGRVSFTANGAPHNTELEERGEGWRYFGGKSVLDWLESVGFSSDLLKVIGRGVAQRVQFGRTPGRAVAGQAPKQTLRRFVSQRGSVRSPGRVGSAFAKPIPEPGVKVKPTRQTQVTGGVGRGGFAGPDDEDSWSGVERSPETEKE